MPTSCAYESIPEYLYTAHSVAKNIYSVYLPIVLLIIFYIRLLGIARKQVHNYTYLLTKSTIFNIKNIKILVKYR